MLHDDALKILTVLAAVILIVCFWFGFFVGDVLF